MKNFVTKLSLLVFIVSTFSCKRYTEVVQTKFLMDTICEIKLLTSNPSSAKKVLNRVFHEIENIDKKFGYTEESEILKINTSAAKYPVRISEETFSLIEKSIEIYKLTNGAFDITTGVLSSLWGFENYSKKEQFAIPQQEDILSSLELVGSNYIVLDKTNNSIFFRKKGMRINLGGIAKGYAIKRAKEILESYQINSFLINFGGDIYVKTGSDKQTPWRIAVQHPRDKNKFLTILELYTTSCATSGDYERYFVVNNKRYHHIFNPFTGYPKENVVSVTVLCDDPIVADALSTGIFVLGGHQGIKLAEKLNIDCIVVEEFDGKLKIYATARLNRLKFDL